VGRGSSSLEFFVLFAYPLVGEERLVAFAQAVVGGGVSGSRVVLDEIALACAALLPVVDEEFEFVGVVVEEFVAGAAEGDSVGGVVFEVGASALGFDVGGVEVFGCSAVLAD